MANQIEVERIAQGNIRLWTDVREVRSRLHYSVSLDPTKNYVKHSTLSEDVRRRWYVTLSKNTPTVLLREMVMYALAQESDELCAAYMRVRWANTVELTKAAAAAREAHV